MMTDGVTGHLRARTALGCETHPHVQSYNMFMHSMIGEYPSQCNAMVTW